MTGWLLLLVAYALMAMVGVTALYCWLTGLTPVELAGRLVTRWRNRHFYEGVDLRTLKDRN